MKYNKINLILSHAQILILIFFLITNQFITVETIFNMTHLFKRKYDRNKPVRSQEKKTTTKLALLFCYQLVKKDQ